MQKIFIKLVFWLVVSSLVGCTHLENKAISKSDPVSVKEQSVEKAEEQKTEQEAKQESKPSNMTAEMMYKVLLSEMLIEKKQPKTAFQVLYPLAVETRDKGLAKRVFHLSMRTLEASSIDAATNLWIDVSPEEDLPWKAAYLLDVRLGKLEPAIKKWQKYISLSDKSLEEVLVETSLRVAKSAPKLAGLSFLKKINDLYPNEPAAMFGLGSAAEEYREFSLAIPKLLESIEAYKNVESDKLTQVSQEIKNEAYYSLANSYLQSEQYQQGVDLILPRIEKNPNDWRLQELLARLEVKTGMLAKAEQRYQLVVKNQPNAYSARLALALLQLERSEHIKAREHLLVLKKNRRYFSVATYYLGVSEQEQSFFKKAIGYFSQIKTLDYYLDAQLRVLEINFPRDGLDKTIKSIENLEINATKTLKDKLKLYHAKAVFFGYENKHQQAVDACQQGLNLYPNNVQMLMSQAQLFYDLKQLERYESNLLLVLKLEPQNVDALNALGYHYVEQIKKLAQAEVMLETANRLEPNSFYIIDSLGWLAYQKKEFNKSEELLEKAFSLRVDLEVLLHLMQAKVQLNKKQEAIEIGKKYRNHFKNNSKLLDLLKRLQN